MTLPRFLGIGAMKAGTTLAWALLEEHPQVALAAHRKEVMFFDRHWSRGVDWYARHFQEAGDRVPGEVTPGYLFHPEAAARIASVVPDVRLFALLRDPIARAESQYRFFVKEHAHQGGPEAFLAEHPNAIARGNYHAQLQRYAAHFSPEQLLVLTFEEFVADPVTGMQRIFRHVGVDDTFRPPSAGERRNASERPRFHRLYTAGRRGIGWLYDHDLAWVVEGAKRAGLRRFFFRPGGGKTDFESFSPALRQRLAQTYRPDALALQEALGRDLTAIWPTLSDTA